MIDMNKSLLCPIGLMAVFLAISLPIAGAQENGSILSKNIAQKNVVQNNSLNRSITNEPALNFTTDPTKLAPTNNATFVISSNTKGRWVKNANTNVSSIDSKIHPLRKIAFVIKGYAMPTLNEFRKNQSLLNAAYLSRRVEGTPHGYVTYYN